MRNRYFNIRDTWDIACATSLIGAFYALLVILFVSWFIPNGASLPLTAFGVLLTVVTPLLLIHCSLSGWWLMQLAGRRLRSHLMLASGMLGLVFGFLVALLWFALIFQAMRLRFTSVPDVRQLAAFGILASIPMAYSVVASLLGALRWRQLEKQEVV